MFVNSTQLEEYARRIREILHDLDAGNAGAVALAVAAEKALADGIQPEAFGRMAETLAHALMMKVRGGQA